MTTQNIAITPLAYSDITASRTRAFWTSSIKDIHSLAHSILQDGLLNPIIVRKAARGYLVVDGSKRLAALRLLQKHDRLPRSLSKVPCIISISQQNIDAPAPLLKSEAGLARDIREAYQAGADHAALAKRFSCTQQTIDYVMSLTFLHPQIFDYFQSGHLNLAQAAAFASLPNMDAQWRLLQELGPFAHAQDVISAILKGQTVVEMPDGNVMIMPSPPTPPVASAPETAQMSPMAVNIEHAQPLAQAA